MSDADHPESPHFVAGAVAAGAASFFGTARPRRPSHRLDDAIRPSGSQHLSAPQYVAEELLRSEGFTEVHYLQKVGPQI
jgi:NitT/TauT family transport system substrate-binding protein